MTFRDEIRQEMVDTTDRRWSLLLVEWKIIDERDSGE